MFATVVASHRPPRAVATPGPFKAAAIWRSEDLSSYTRWVTGSRHLRLSARISLQNRRPGRRRGRSLGTTILTWSAKASGSTAIAPADRRVEAGSAGPRAAWRVVADLRLAV